MVWHLYNRMLSKHPYVTRSFVAAGMMSSGDIINQRVFERTKPHEIARSSRFALYGFAFHAPILAQWFKIMDKIQFKSSRWTIGTRVSFSSPLLHLDFDLADASLSLLPSQVALAQTVWGSFSITMFYTIMSLLEGHSFEQAKEKVVVGEFSSSQPFFAS
ncbi:hypothetical protein BDY24DRAFT_236845 [Mrakia frigida]|uniref:uncharacterized protein n=1 Tax=Mrakia frigida TaxID=29902 RepID=UPI003FCC034B